MLRVLKDVIRSSGTLYALLKPLVIGYYQGRNFVMQAGVRAHNCVGAFQSVKRWPHEDFDIVLDELSKLPKVRFLQIGSNDGKTTDPIFHFSSCRENWNGVLVEPVPFVFQRLKDNYDHSDRHQYLNMLVSEKAGMQNFFYVRKNARDAFPDLPGWYDQLGGFTREHITAHLGERIMPYIENAKLHCLTVPELLKKTRMPECDLLHIDTEGHDFKILKQFDLKKLNAKFIIVEFKHLSYWECYQLLRKLQYSYYLFENQSDVIAVSKRFFTEDLKALS